MKKGIASYGNAETNMITELQQLEDKNVFTPQEARELMEEDDTISYLPQKEAYARWRFPKAEVKTCNWG